MSATANPMSQLRITKVCVNIGVGEGGERLVNAENVLEMVTGVKPQRTLGRIQNRDLKVRIGAPIGCKATMRKLAHGCFAPNGGTDTNLEVSVLNAAQGSLWLDAGDHFENVFSVHEAFTTFTHADVHAHLGDAQLTHGVGCGAHSATSVSGMLASPIANTLRATVPKPSN